MLSRWPEYRLDELTELIADCPHSTPVWTNSGVVVLRNQNIRNGRLNLSDPSFTTEEGYQARTKRARPEKEDIVLTREAPMGEVCIIPDGLRCCLGQRMVLIRANRKKVLPQYLLYALQSDYLKHQISWSEGTGTTVSNIRIPLIESFLIPTPDLQIQKFIVEILAFIDFKIDHNTQLNQALESMAHALFKSWFVDFDPVIDNAIAAGNPIPEPFQARAERRRQRLHEPVPEGQSPLQPLPADLRQLFPNSFQETEELGWVPEGWGVVSVSEAIEVNPRVSLKKGVTAKYADMKVLPTSGYCISEIDEKEYAGGAKFTQGDVLLARITPCLENGKTAIVDFLNSDEVGFGSTEFIVLRGRGSLKTSFIACLARLQAFRDHCIQNMVGSSGRQRVQNSCFTSFHLALPMQDAVTKLFDEKAKDFFEKSSLNSRQNCSLSSLRDALLPKLLSGQLRIPDAEAQLAEAGL